MIVSQMQITKSPRVPLLCQRPSLLFFSCEVFARRIESTECRRAEAYADVGLIIPCHGSHVGIGGSQTRFDGSSRRHNRACLKHPCMPGDDELDGVLLAGDSKRKYRRQEIMIARYEAEPPCSKKKI